MRVVLFLKDNMLRSSSSLTPSALIRISISASGTSCAYFTAGASVAAVAAVTELRRAIAGLAGELGTTGAAAPAVDEVTGAARGASADDAVVVGAWRIGDLDRAGDGGAALLEVGVVGLLASALTFLGDAAEEAFSFDTRTGEDEDDGTSVAADVIC